MSHRIVQAALIITAIMLTSGCGQTPRPVERPIDAQSLFAVNCAICHGASGLGDGMAAGSMKPPPPRLDASFLGSRPRTELETAIRVGIRRDGRQTMPPAKDLSDPEVRSLVDYLFVLARESGK